VQTWHCIDVRTLLYRSVWLNYCGTRPLVIMLCPSVQQQQQQQPFYSPLSGTTQVSWYQEKHSSTHTYPDHQPSFISFLCLLQSKASSDSLFAQPFSTSSLVYCLVWNPPLYTPYISSPNYCLLFTTSAYTTAACFALVQRLCHLFLVSLSTLYLELYLLP